MRGKNPKTNRPGLSRSVRSVSGKLPTTADIPQIVASSNKQSSQARATATQSSLASTAPIVSTSGQTIYDIRSISGRCDIDIKINGQEIEIDVRGNTIGSMAFNKIDQKRFIAALKCKDDYAFSAGHYSLRLDYFKTYYSVTPTWRDNKGDWHDMPGQEFMIDTDDAKEIVNILRKRRFKSLFNIGNK